MTSDNRWLLPDGIDALLPERAAVVEALRRQLLDHCYGWGYRYVIPPLVEFTDALLVGLGADLDVLTCKFGDRLSGRTMGVRADITPQVARIDAHSLGEPGVTRLCYAGSTLHSAPQSVMASRSPIQLGAELFGCASIDADLEVIRLLLVLLKALNIAPNHKPITLDVGHVGVYQAIMTSADLDGNAQKALFDALQRKSAPDLALALAGVDDTVAATLRALAQLHGDASVLAEARVLLQGESAALVALDQVAAVVDVITREFSDVAIYIDLSELRGFEYHTGLVFAAYLEGVGTAVAKGGRYDNIGSVFGRQRPATGFACDVKALAAASVLVDAAQGAIAAPVSDDPALALAVAQLRAEGRVVIAVIDGLIDPHCCEQLIKSGTAWQLIPLQSVES